MHVTETTLPGVLLFTPCVFTDERGQFCETYNERLMQQTGLPKQWVQDNFSVSKAGTVRGIHYQVVRPQGKLVHVVFGRVIDVAIDLRRSSPNFGRHVTTELSDENAAMLWIPAGFGHGFAVLSERAGFAYKVTDYHAPQGERTILWNDPELAIQWQIDPEKAIVSEKDRQGRPFTSAEVFR